MDNYEQLYPLMSSEIARENTNITLEEYRVRCTYTELFTKDGKKMFSVQGSDFDIHTNSAILGASADFSTLLNGEYDTDGLVPLEMSSQLKLYIESKTRKKQHSVHKSLLDMLNGGIVYVKLAAITPESGEEEIDYIEEPKTKDYSKLKWIAIALAASLFL